MIERLLESVVWNSRLIVLIPVLASLLLAIAGFIMTTVDAVVLLWQMVAYLDAGLTEIARDGMRLATVSSLIEVLVGYLLAAIMLIFSLGLYELFINRVNQAEQSEFAARLLLIRSLDDLKDRLATVILLIIIIKFFQQALNLKYENAVDLLLLALGIVLIAGALYLMGRAHPGKPVNRLD